MENNQQNVSAKSAGPEAKKSFIQLIKFAIVGASNTLVDMIVNIALT